MMHRESWHGAAIDVLRDLGAAHVDIPLDTIPFDEYVKDEIIQ